MVVTERYNVNLWSVYDMTNDLRKSLLYKAFHRELGTNNVEDESAIELLKTIFADT